MTAGLRVLNVSKARPGEFPWFDGRLPPDLGARFIHCRGGPANSLERRITRPNIALQRGCMQAAWHVARGEVDLIVSHLPVVTQWTEFYLQGTRRSVPHIAFSFNQDPMPTGIKRAALARLFRNVDRFVVFSTAECELYAKAFGIPRERLHMFHWGVVPPQADPADPPVVEGEYITSIGRTHRNYADLVEAMRRLPHIRCIVVAGFDNLAGLDVPPNVEVLTEIPFSQVLNVLYHSRMLVLPLHDTDVPYGHGTAVLGMHMRRPVVVTEGRAMSDYIKEGETGITFPAGDHDRLAEHITGLLADEQRAAQLAQSAYTFAQEFCTEEATLKKVIPLLLETRRAG